MRRVFTVVVGAMLLASLGVPGASAAPQKYNSKVFNAYWTTRQWIDSDTYLRTTWYSGVYESGDGFWSDLYKDVERCDQRAGNDRCKSVRFWYGDINDLGTGSFTMDSKLASGHLTATYKLQTYKRGQRVVIGKTTVSVDLVGTGHVARSSDSSTYSSGCVRFSYRDHYKTRDANATGTYQIGTGTAHDFGGVSDPGTFMSVGKALEIDTSHCHG